MFLGPNTALSARSHATRLVRRAFPPDRNLDDVELMKGDAIVLWLFALAQKAAAESLAPSFPGWLAPVIGLAEEAGEDAPVVGYGIMGATGVLIGLVFAIAGLGAFGFLMTMAGTGYACWQASPYLSEIGSKFDVAPTQPPSADEDED